MSNIITIGYARVSTDEQEKNGFSISSQISDVSAHADKNGWHLEEMYVDEGYSASSLKRPRMQALLRYISSTECDGFNLIVRHPDRLTRSLTHKRSLECVFKKYSVNVICLQSNWRGSDVETDVITDITMLFSEVEVKKIPQRTLDGMRGSAELGNYSVGSKAPRGFKKVFNERAGKGKMLVPDEEKAEGIINIFLMLKTNQWNMRELASYLDKTKYLGWSWDVRSLGRVVNNPIYYGHLKTRYLDIRHHTYPMITEELFYEVYNIVHHKKTMTYHNYIFSRSVWCSKCQTFVTNQPSWKTTRKGKKILYRYYYCKQCNKRINEKELLQELAIYYSSTIKDSVAYESKNKINAKIKKLTNILNMHQYDYLNDLVDYDKFLEKTLPIRKEINTLEEELKRIMDTSLKSIDKLSFTELRGIVLKHIDKVEVNFEAKKTYFQFKETKNSEK